MALKTGYKVNGKEIILDDYEKYTEDETLKAAVQEKCCETLQGWYKVGGELIKASSYKKSDNYSWSKGQLPAEIPRGTYYKSKVPSGFEIPYFALYGTNTAGGWIDNIATPKQSPHWEEYYGSTVPTDIRKTIIISFKQDDNGTYLTATEDGVVKKLRTYVLDDGTPLFLDTIKVWCYIVGAGGGGYPYLDDKVGAAGGGAGAAAISIKLTKDDELKILIPPRTGINKDGGETDLYLNNSLLLYAYGGKHPKTYQQGGEGGTAGGYPSSDQTMLVMEGGKGGNGHTSNESEAKGVSTPTTNFASPADYYNLWENEVIPGGAAFRAGTSGDYIPGGGAAGFPMGKGGYISMNPSTSGYIYAPPGPGGGGSGQHTSYSNSGIGGYGAFWILYA